MSRKQQVRKRNSALRLALWLAGAGWAYIQTGCERAKPVLGQRAVSGRAVALGLSLAEPWASQNVPRWQTGRCARGASSRDII